MAINKDTAIFDDISFSDIARDIYTKKKEKDIQINTLITELKPFIKNINDAALLIPLLKEYLEISVKNDEVLVKLSSILQKLITSESGVAVNEFTLTETEKAQLLSEAAALRTEASMKLIK